MTTNHDHPDATSTTFYRSPDGDTYRVTVVPDADASSPRENDNATVIHTFDSHWLSPDRDNVNGRESVTPLVPRDYVEDGRADMRRIRKWVALFGQSPDVGILAIAGVERIEGGWAEGGLTITTNDGRADGYVAITRESWDMCMGADCSLDGSPWMLDEFGKPDPASTRRTPSAREVMTRDVAEYSRWAAGESVGVIVERETTWVRADSIDNEGAHDDDDEMRTWEQVEDGALWGIDDESYALEWATGEILPTGSTVIVPVPA